MQDSNACNIFVKTVFWILQKIYTDYQCVKIILQMKGQEKILFEQLKKEVTQTFLEDFPTLNPDISKWKGLDIIYFQEHLRQKVRGNVSEKWFYTYFKSSFEKLPRIDMLNLLTQYCGYKRGWTEFQEKYQSKISQDNPTSHVTNGPLINKTVGDDKKIFLDNVEVKINGYDDEAIQTESLGINVTKNKNHSFGIKKLIYILLGLITLLVVVFSIDKYYEYRNTFKFCFYDADRSSLIKSKLEIIIQKNGVSPEYYTVSNGCFTYRSSTDTLKMTISSPMYKKESFVVGLKEIRDKGEENNRNFKLRPDDYAIMLYYYSTGLNDADENKKSQLIKQRKEELNKLIADDALIYQVYDNEIFGVEVLDKKKYIDFMTTPTTSLKNYILINSQINKNKKIDLIKFKIQKNEK